MLNKATKMIMCAFLCASLLSMTITLNVNASPYDDNSVNGAVHEIIIGPDIQEILDLLEEVETYIDPMPEEYWSNPSLKGVFLQKIEITKQLVSLEALEGALNKVTHDLIPKIDMWIVDEESRQVVSELMLEIEDLLGGSQ